MTEIDELLLDVQILCAQAQLNQLKINKKMYMAGLLSRDNVEDSHKKILSLMTLPERHTSS
jgi:hypothetical protein